MTQLLADVGPAAGIEAPLVVRVQMGQCAVGHAPTTLRTVGLGSCLAIAIFAPVQQLVALAHCLLPQRQDDDAVLEKYVDSAVPHLLASLRAAGGSEPFTAALVGGASMFPGVAAADARDIGAANIAAARAMLTNSAVPVRSEDVGGHVGRSVLVDPVTQRVIVHTIRGGERCL